MNEIVALYKFVYIEKPLHIKKILRSRLNDLNIYGTILIGEEGINGTISSDNSSQLSQAICFIKSIKGFKDLDLKFSQSAKKPFIRLKVKLKKEIVTIGDTKINPNELAGEYVDPKDWNKLIEDEETIIIDTRNNYEYSIGTFKNSINPKTKKFREFPEWLEKQNYNNHDKKNKKIAMFCTGGIRCEKANIYLKKKGFKNVYVLKGGIINYLNNIDRKNSHWSGECFVFDNRVSIKHGLKQGSYSVCSGCRKPLSIKEKKSSKYLEGIHCPKCHDYLTDDQKSRFAMRQKQIILAKKTGKRHIFKKEY